MKPTIEEKQWKEIRTCLLMADTLINESIDDFLEQNPKANVSRYTAWSLRIQKCLEETPSSLLLI